MTWRRGSATTLAMAAVLCTVWFIGSARTAHACSCVATTEAEQNAAAEIIFIGRATAVQDLPADGAFTGREYTVRVERLHKGEITDPVTIRTAQDSAACGVEVPLDTLYKFLPRRDGGGYVINLCGGNRTATEADLQPIDLSTTTSTPPATSGTSAVPRPTVTATTGTAPSLPTSTSSTAVTLPPSSTTTTALGDEAAVGIDDDDDDSGGGGLLRTVGSMAVAAVAGAGIAVWRQRRVAARQLRSEDADWYE